MVLGERDVEEVAHQRRPGEALVVVAGRAVGLHRDRQVKLAASEQIEHLGALDVLNNEFDRRRAIAQQRDRGHDQAADRGRERPDPDATALSAGERRERRVHPLKLAEQRVGVREHGLGRRRQPDGAAVREQQRLPDLLLERRQLLRDRRGREVQRVGRRGDRAAVGELSQGAQTAELDHEAQLTSLVKKV